MTPISVILAFFLFLNAFLLVFFSSPEDFADYAPEIDPEAAYNWCISFFAWEGFISLMIGHIHSFVLFLAALLPLFIGHVKND